MKKRGKGIGSIFYGTGYGNGFPDVSRSVAVLRKDGKVEIYTGATEVGQGSKTVLSQIAAETLGISIEDVIFICEDTSITPDAGTAAASRQTYNTGNAIKKSCEELKRKIIDVTVKASGADAWEEINLRDVALNHKGQILKGEGEFIAETTEMKDETGQGNPYWPYTFNVYGVEVEVDTTNGVVEVIKAVCAQDVGRAINPKLIEGQMDGGFAMGLSYALFEDLNIKNGEIKHNKLTNYLIPTAMDVPDLEKIIVEDPEATGPYGAKGIGEPVMIGVAPAILNAIYDAIGVRITELPATPNKILLALKKKREVAL